MTKQESASPTAWAEHVLAIFEAGNVCNDDWPIARRELYEWAVNPVNKEKFYTQMVPKAVEILHKHGDDEAEQYVAREERRAIAELQQMLNETVAGIK